MLHYNFSLSNKKLLSCRRVYEQRTSVLYKSIWHLVHIRGLLLKMSNYDANGGSASQASPIYLEHRLVITTIMTQRRKCLTKEAQFT